MQLVGRREWVGAISDLMRTYPGTSWTISGSILDYPDILHSGFRMVYPETAENNRNYGLRIRSFSLTLNLHNDPKNAITTTAT
jgi:hypothetical protein